MNTHYDVVIIGARCAGATLATYLARADLRVLLVDRSPLPSDLVLSTHTVHPSGMAVMNDLGLGEAVRARSPEMKNIFFDWHGAALDVALKPGDGEYCPRRTYFDGLLQQAAAQAGAHVLERTPVVGLIAEGGRVRGVKVERSDGHHADIHASLVVGADGRKSRVAQWVGAEEYMGYDPPRGMYWGYFPAPRGWGRCADFPAGMYLHRKGTRILVAFHTDDDQLLVGVLPTLAELPAFRADPLGSLRREGQTHPLFAAALAPAPIGAVRGYLGDRYFFRRPVGSGWLLLGDAGHHKDFLTGDGMSEALIRARAAASAILDALGGALRQPDRAFERFWRERDVEALPLYFHGMDRGAVHDTPTLDRVVFDYLQRNAQAKATFAGIFDRKTPPHKVIAPGRAASLCLAAALRGQPRIVREFWRRARQSRQIEHHINAARRHLEATLAPLAHA